MSASQSQIQYQWIIKSNATRRTVAVEVGGSLYLLRPGSALLINGTLSASLNNWNVVSLAVNGTQYAVDLYVELTPPTINVGSINSITFTDNRVFHKSASCSTPIGTVTFNVKVHSMSGTITYSGNTINFSGSMTLYVDKLGENITASYSGSSTNGVGQVSATVGSYTITVSFSGRSITSITVNGQQVSCGASIIPIPRFMYDMPPTGSMDAVSLGARLANLFARGGQDSQDLIKQAYYDGRSVVLIDGAGYTMRFDFNGGLSISGPLSASASAHN